VEWLGSQLETGKLKLQLAQRLDASLRDENVRWSESMEVRLLRLRCRAVMYARVDE
jgi:hypothetical protein